MKATLTASDAERFWSNVDRTSTCWHWIGYVNPSGYGRFRLRIDGRARVLQAHRIAFELSGNEIPPGKVLDHICRVRDCVNPEHLRPLDNVENVLIGIGPSAINARKTHCKHGHPFSPENTYVSKKGHRLCRTCRLAAKRVGNAPADRTHCPKGHPYDEANTEHKLTSRGTRKRVCRTCKAAWWKAWREKNPTRRATR